MARDQWTWTFADADEGPLTETRSPTFTSRFDAEAWLGESWRELARGGVATAQLRHNATPVAPPLPLP